MSSPSPGRAAPASNNRAGHRRGGRPLVVVRRARGRRPGRRGRRGAPGLRRGDAVTLFVLSVILVRAILPVVGVSVVNAVTLIATLAPRFPRWALFINCPLRVASANVFNFNEEIPAAVDVLVRRQPPSLGVVPRCAKQGPSGQHSEHGVTRGELGLHTPCPVIELETPGNLDETRVLRVAVDGPYSPGIVYVVHGLNPLHDTTFQQPGDFRPSGSSATCRQKPIRPVLMVNMNIEQTGRSATDPRRVVPRRDAHERMAALHPARQDLDDLAAADRPPVHPAGLVRGGRPFWLRPRRDRGGHQALVRRDRGPIQLPLVEVSSGSALAAWSARDAAARVGGAGTGQVEVIDDELVTHLPRQRPPHKEYFEARLGVVNVPA